MSDGGSELLRPAPPVTWRDRADVLRTWVTARPWSVLVALVVGAVGVVLAAIVVLRPPAVAAPPAEVLLPRASAGDGASAGTTVPPSVVVHVAGAVLRPGLVRLAGGARVADAVEAAGGLRPDADVDRLNLAAPLLDGQRVWVPVSGQEPPSEVVPEGGAGPATGPGGGSAVVDLNTATAADLEALPGIGPATAQAILDHRGRIGRFRAVDDLLDVRGIGPSKLAALRDRVRV